MHYDRSPSWIFADLSPFWMLLVVIATGCTDAARSDSRANAPKTPAAVPQIREPYHIEITGSKDRWHVRYPGADGEVASESDARTVRNIHIPLQTKVVLVLKSTDYIYTLALPQFGLKEIAVPDLEFRMELCPPAAGRFELVGNQLCGDPHAELDGFLIVEPTDRFFDWLTNAGEEDSRR